MSTINFEADTPVCLEYEKRYPVIDFGFIISGTINRQITRADDRFERLPVVSGEHRMEFNRFRPMTPDVQAVVYPVFCPSII